MSKEMKTFEIPVVWQMSGVVKVQGTSLEDAMNTFNRNVGDYPLPKNGHYVEDSFELATEDVHEMEEMVTTPKMNKDLFFPQEEKIYFSLLEEMKHKTPFDYTWFNFLTGKEELTVIDEFKNENSFLSNFFTSPITYFGITYQSVEAAFQAQKAKTTEERLMFAKLKPNEAKKLGRKIALREDWEIVKYQIMYELCWLKFFKNEELGAMLDATYPKVLVEGNYWHDNTWGSCTCDKCKDKVSYNMLGKILMRIRMERRLMLNEKYRKVVIERHLDEIESSAAHNIDFIDYICLESNFENVRFHVTGIKIYDANEEFNKPQIEEFGGISHLDMKRFMEIYFSL